MYIPRPAVLPCNIMRYHILNYIPSNVPTNHYKLHNLTSKTNNYDSWTHDSDRFNAISTKRRNPFGASVVPRVAQSEGAAASLGRSSDLRRAAEASMTTLVSDGIFRCKSFDAKAIKSIFFLNVFGLQCFN